jgi:hypothetical protein
MTLMRSNASDLTTPGFGKKKSLKFKKTKMPKFKPMKVPEFHVKSGTRAKKPRF